MVLGVFRKKEMEDGKTTTVVNCLVNVAFHELLIPTQLNKVGEETKQAGKQINKKYT